MTAHDRVLALCIALVLGVIFFAGLITGRRLEAAPTVTSSPTTTTTVATTTTGPTVPDGNVYRDAEGHCFGTTRAEAERRGLTADPSCPGSGL